MGEPEQRPVPVAPVTDVGPQIGAMVTAFADAGLDIDDDPDDLGVIRP